MFRFHPGREHRGSGTVHVENARAVRGRGGRGGRGGPAHTEHTETKTGT